MTNFRPYGAAAILVSAGIMITGVLWYDRRGSHIRGEDLAELLAAVSERQTVAYCTNSLPYFQWTTQTVSNVIEWDVLYEKTLGAIRNMATVDITNTSAIRIWWAVPELEGNTPKAWVWPEDGDTLSRADTVEWNMTTGTLGTTTRRTYTACVASNAHSDWLTSSTRNISDPYRCKPGVDGTNRPIAGIFYNHFSTLDIPFAPFANWWPIVTTNDMTNVYKFACEKWHGPDNDDLTITRIYGGGFTISPTNISISYGDTSFHPVAVQSFGSDTNHMSAALYAVEHPYKETVYFAVSDSGTQANMNIVLSDLTKSVTKGSMAAFTVRPAANPAQYPRVMTIATAGDISVNPTTKIWTSNNWETAEVITITAADNYSGGDSAGIVRILYDNNANHIAVGIVDYDDDYDDIKLDNSLHTIEKGASCNVGVGLVKGSTNFYVTAGQWITSNNLNDARRALTNMTRTVAVVPFSYLTATNKMLHAISYINIGTNLTDVYDITDSEGLWDSIQELIAPEEPEPTELNSELASIHIQVRFSSDTYYDVSEAESIYDAEGYIKASYNFRRFTGCNLPYPSLSAYANGYVSRVKIFAVCSGSVQPQSQLIHFLMAGTTNRTDTFLCYNYEPFALDHLTLGAASCLAVHAPVPSLVTDISNTVRFVTSPNPGIKEYKLSLLADDTNPTTPTFFDLGPTDFNKIPHSDSVPRGISETVTYWWDWEDDSWTTITDISEADHTVNILCFLVWVEWNWNHMNPDTPFVPTAHTPEWASTNAP